MPAYPPDDPDITQHAQKTLSFAEEHVSMADIQMGKTVANRIQTGDIVVAAADSHSAEVAAQLRELLVEVPALELTPSQVEPFIKSLSALLHAATRDLDSKEREYIAELADDIEPRAEQETRTAAGAALMNRASELISAAVGNDGLGKYGLNSPVSRNPREVARRMRTTIELLEANPMQATDALGTVFDSDKVLEKLRSAFGPFEEANKVVAREDQEKQRAAAARDEAIEAWADIYQGVTGALCGLYRLSGRADLAELYAPTSTKISGQSDEEDS